MDEKEKKPVNNKVFARVFFIGFVFFSFMLAFGSSLGIFSILGLIFGALFCLQFALAFKTWEILREKHGD